MKRFLIFGITDCSDMTAGARGYLGQFETFEELIETIKNNKEKILNQNIESFNILDLMYDEMIVDLEYDFWELININRSMDNFEFVNDEIFKLRKRILKRITPVATYLNQVAKDMEIEEYEL